MVGLRCSSQQGCLFVLESIFSAKQSETQKLFYFLTQWAPLKISFCIKKCFSKSTTWQKWPYSTSGLDSYTLCHDRGSKSEQEKMPFQRFYPRHIVGVHQMPRWDFPLGKTWKQQMGSAFLKPSQVNEAVGVICLIDKPLWNWMRRCTCNGGKWVWPKVFLTQRGSGFSSGPVWALTGVLQLKPKVWRGAVSRAAKTK